MSQRDRVIAYFEFKGDTRLIKGLIIQSLHLKAYSQPNYYELRTDEIVDFRIRDAEVQLKADRKTEISHSLFVIADQCAPDTDVQPPPPLPPSHPKQKQTAGYQTGDPVTLPIEEAPNGLINGIVGYTGIFNNYEVAEVCVDQATVTSAFISKIRGRYEVPGFPDERRHFHFKGYSLVVVAGSLLPGAHVDISQKGVNGNLNKEKTFAQAVSSSNSPHSRKPSKYGNSDYPSQNKEFENFNLGEVPEERQDDFIISLNYNDPILVVTDYGYLNGFYRRTLEISHELHVGIELVEVPPGSPAFWKTPDGVLHDKRLFECRPGHGALVHISKCRVSRSTMHGARGSGEMTVSEDSTLRGLPNLFHNSHITITQPNEFYPPLNTVREIIGDNKGIQGHMNSCYMDASLFGMFAFSSTFDPLFLKEQCTHPGAETPSIQRYNHVRNVLQTRIVFPLRKTKFVRADQIMMLRRDLNNAGIIDGLMQKEKDPEEFLKVLLQHVLNAEPYLKLKRESQEINAEYIYQIFSSKQANVTLPTVQFLLEHSFKEHKIILDSAPHVLLLQMPRCGKDFKMYPRIFPSLQLSLDNLTSTTYGPKCIVCLGDATYRCPDCEDIKLFYYTNVFVYYCEKCVETVHTQRQLHKPIRLLLQKGEANLPPGKMELFAILTIETSHYVCFSRCKTTWVMFDSMADREGQEFGRNIPRVTELPLLEEWLSSPDKLSDWMATDRTKSNPIPHYVDRITRDTYLCMYHSEQVSMF